MRSNFWIFLGLGALAGIVALSLGLSPVMLLLLGVAVLVFRRRIIRLASFLLLLAMDRPWFGQRAAQKLAVRLMRNRASEKRKPAPDPRPDPGTPSAPPTAAAPRDFREDYAQGHARGTLGSMLPHQDSAFVPWLLQQGSDDAYVALRCGFNQDMPDIVQIVRHPTCDRATARLAYMQHFDLAWFDRAEVFEDGFAERVLARNDPYDPFLIPVIIGTNMQQGFYPDGGLRQGPTRFHAPYAAAWDAAAEGDLPGWVLPPAEFAPREGREADSPYLFGDLHAVYRSKEVERAMTAAAST